MEQAAAAALAVRADVFARLGGFDERFVPAWYEDVDLCERLGREGKILYLPDARFRHRGGESASRLGYDRFLPIFYRNALRYRDAPLRPGARRAGYRALLAAGMAAPPAPLAVPPATSRVRAPRRPARTAGVLRPGLRARSRHMTPDVSILVVSKDDAADLPVSLGSALAQRGAACETLLVDNASTDDSREVARGLARFGASAGAARERRLRRRR